MEQRSSITKWLLLGLAVFLLWTFGRKAIFGDKVERQPLSAMVESEPPTRAEATTCPLEGAGYRTDVSSRGASLRDYWLTDEGRYYRKDPAPEGVFAQIQSTFSPEYGKPRGPLNLTTTNPNRTSRPGDVGKADLVVPEGGRMPLRTDLHVPGDDAQVGFDEVDWRLSDKSEPGKRCVFVYEEKVGDKLISRVTKTLSATDKPYEIAVELTVENLDTAPRKHRLTIEHAAWRTEKEMAGSLGRTSDWITETIASGDKTERHSPGDFEPSDFPKDGNQKEFTSEMWRRAPGAGQWASVSAAYMAQIVVAGESADPPSAETLIEERWATHLYGDDKAKDEHRGYVFRARLAYPEKTLAAGESASYKARSFAGPKEREVLAQLAPSTTEVINLGTFSFIGKLLVRYLYLLRGLIGSWGWAICLMTITVRLLLFPLSIAQIKSTVVMRRLKPEVDEINERYKDNATQKGLALQELYRKNGVNPVMGCIPALLQMPVWFALYSALQTAVELYHVPFGPVIPDLSSPGKYFIIPAVLGISSFTQQKIMPMQGDPAQQKMLLYMMPTVFTVMMLFLPAGLGVYMVTNSILGIVQQLLVERYLKKRVGPTAGIQVKDVTGDKGDSDKTSGSGANRRQLLERGKARG